MCLTSCGSLSQTKAKICLQPAVRSLPSRSEITTDYGNVTAGSPFPFKAHCIGDYSHFWGQNPKKSFFCTALSDSLQPREDRDIVPSHQVAFAPFPRGSSPVHSPAMARGPWVQKCRAKTESSRPETEQRQLGPSKAKFSSGSLCVGGLVGLWGTSSGMDSAQSTHYLEQGGAAGELPSSPPATSAGTWQTDAIRISSSPRIYPSGLASGTKSQALPFSVAAAEG